MNSRRETMTLVAILVGCVALGSVLGPLILGTDSSHRKGDPNDVTSLVSHDTLLNPGSLRRGASPARFTLVEFADYECQSCGRAEPKVRDLLDKRKDLCLVFRHFPMTGKHPNSVLAAHAAEVARRMGKGWEMHDALFDHQSEWSYADDVRGELAVIAGSIGLDARRFAAALAASATGEVAFRIEADQQAAAACSVDNTPSFFLVTPTHTWAAVGPVGLDRLLRDARYWR